MNFLFSILVLLSFAGLIIGLFKPALVIRWGNKRKRRQVFLIYGSSFFISLVISGITAPKPNEKAKIDNTAIEVQLTATHRIDSGGLFFDVKTNLPTQMRTVFFLKSDIGDNLGGCDAVVENGNISVGPFSNRGNPHNPGNYVLKISADYLNQPNDVSQIIGEKGANLKGTLISDWSGGRRVNFEYPFTIGDPDQIKAATSLRVQQINELENIVSHIEKRATELESGYKKQPKANLGAWVANWNRETQQWRERIENEINFQTASFCQDAFSYTQMSISDLVLLGVGYIYFDRKGEKAIESQRKNLLEDLQHSTDAIAQCRDNL